MSDNEQPEWTCEACTFLNKPASGCCDMCGCGRPVAPTRVKSKASPTTLTIKTLTGTTSTAIVSENHLVLDVMEMCAQQLGHGPLEFQQLLALGVWLRPGRRVGTVTAHHNTWHQPIRLSASARYHSYFHQGLAYQYVEGSPSRQEVPGYSCHRPLRLTGGRRVSSVTWISQRDKDSGHTVSSRSVHAANLQVRDEFGRCVAASGPRIEQMSRAPPSADCCYRLTLDVPLAAGRHWVTVNADMSAPDDHHETREAWQREKWTRVVAPVLPGTLVPELVELCRGYDSWVGFGRELPFRPMVNSGGDLLVGCIVQEIDFF